MSAEQSRRGGTPIGYVADLPATEAAAVAVLRRWCAGPEGQAMVWNDFATVLGPVTGRAHLRDLERFVGLLAGRARRPVMRHCPGCACLGADEGILAAMIGAAEAGEREEAALLAALLVRADAATSLAAAAETLAVALRRVAVRAAREVREVREAGSATHAGRATRH